MFNGTLQTANDNAKQQAFFINVALDDSESRKAAASELFAKWLAECLQANGKGPQEDVQDRSNHTATPLQMSTNEFDDMCKEIVAAYPEGGPKAQKEAIKPWRLLVC
eukprot:2599971-Rhodomonas_salina.1